MISEPSWILTAAEHLEDGLLVLVWTCAVHKELPFQIFVTEYMELHCCPLTRVTSDHSAFEASALQPIYLEESDGVRIDNVLVASTCVGFVASTLILQDRQIR